MLPDNLMDLLFNILDKRGIKHNETSETVSGYFINDTEQKPAVSFYDYYFSLVISLIEKDYKELFCNNTEIMDEINNVFIITSNRSIPTEDNRIDIELSLNIMDGKYGK